MNDEKNLHNHRLSIKNNKNSFLIDKDRAFNKICDHMWEWVKSINPKAKKDANTKVLMLDLAKMIFEAQDCKPLFQFGNEITAWNRPQYWEHNYIKYEIGHKKPKNSGGDSHPENLCFMSARCNQHIQSSLDMNYVLEWYFSNNSEVQDRIANLENLYHSNLWKEKINQLTGSSRPL